MFPIFNRGIFLRFPFCISTINKMSEFYNRGIFLCSVIRLASRTLNPTCLTFLSKLKNITNFPTEEFSSVPKFNNFLLRELRAHFPIMEMKNPVCYHFHLNINIHHSLNASNFQQRNFPLFSILYLDNQ